MSRYCVIGAGAAGVSALKQLREAGHEGECLGFSTEVVAVTPEPSGAAPAGSAGWRVITSRGHEGVFDGVLVARLHAPSRVA